jgi:hypothetical protein
MVIGVGLSATVAEEPGATERRNDEGWNQSSEAVRGHRSEAPCETFPGLQININIFLFDLI